MRWIVTNRIRHFYIKPYLGVSKIEANVLVVKDIKYVRVAKICVESFCFFNTNGIVKVHVDNVTRRQTESAFRSLVRKKRVIVVDVLNNELKWQIQKLDLICSIVAENSIFMDADLRWNGPLPKISGVTFFVQEFSFNQNDDYKSMLKTVLPDKSSFGTMKNTSFFSWGNLVLNEELKSRIYELENEISNYFLSLKTKSQTPDERYRMSEQLALSLAFDEFPSIEISYLKPQDGFKDGLFVESSYFGATGASF